MKPIPQILLVLLLTGKSLFAHNLDSRDFQPRHWELKKEVTSKKAEGKSVSLASLLPESMKDAASITHCEKKTATPVSLDGWFLLCRDGRVFIELPDGSTRSFAIASLSEKDQQFVREREAEIAALNRPVYAGKTPDTESPLSSKLPWFLSFTGLMLLAAFFFRKSPLKALGSMGIITASLAFLPGFRIKETASVLSNDPIAMDSAFAPFKPDVYTRWDSNWFYVESKGIPKHEMMTGITGWQRQAPIQQCYTGTNAWQIPMNPVMAADPIPVNQQHFTRGGIAVAVNGIAIFNPYTNTGLDALVDGQLDNWGGHCGRADDYHYHIAPLHLYAQSSPSQPIAFGFDGFPVFGNTEPDGAAMETLDANHGHMWNGKYHYHGTSAAPYMIAKMAGVVTEDSTHQIIPQSRAKPVRPSGTPLTGAAITAFQAFPGGRSYAMYYTLAGQNYAWIYNWNQAVTQYTFRYCTPTDTTTTTYNGPGDCFLPTSKNNLLETNAGFRAWPNPVASGSVLHLSAAASMRHIRLVSTDGKTVLEQIGQPASLPMRNIQPGLYLLNATLSNGQMWSQRIIVR
jgi:hypothetical protein